MSERCGGCDRPVPAQAAQTPWRGVGAPPSSRRRRRRRHRACYATQTAASAKFAGGVAEQLPVVRSVRDGESSSWRVALKSGIAAAIVDTEYMTATVQYVRVRGVRRSC